MSVEEENVGEGETQEAGKGETPGASQAELEAMKANVSNLEEKLRQVQDEVLTPDYLEFLSVRGGGEKVAPQEEEQEVDLTLMDNPQLAKEILKRSEAAANAMVGPLKKSYEDLSQKHQKALAQVDFELTLLRHPDMRKGIDDDKEYRAAFEGAIRENPSWGAEKLYEHVRVTQRVKAQEALERKKAQEEKELQARTEEVSSVPGSAVTGKDLTPDEAGDLAYRMTYGNAGAGEEQ